MKERDDKKRALLNRLPSRKSMPVSEKREINVKREEKKQVPQIQIDTEKYLGPFNIYSADEATKAPVDGEES